MASNPITAKKIRLPRDQGGDGFQGALFPYATVTITFTDTAQKNTDSITAQIVRLIATADCHVKFHDATDDKATTADMFFKANTVEYFHLLGKQFISAINDSGAGSSKLYVTVMI